MSDHFDDGLRDLASRAAQAHAAGPGLPGPVIAARARRKRRVHDAVVGTTSAAAVAAVVLTGATLVDRPAPTPPESATPDPGPTAAPTDEPRPTTDPAPGAVRLPQGDPSLPFGECGSVVGSTVGGPVAKDLEIVVNTTWLWTFEGAPLTVTSSTWLGGYGEGSLVPEEGPRFIVTLDGVVVAVGDALGGHGDGDGVRLVDGGEPLMHAGRLDLTVCDPAGSPGVDVGAALPIGDYELTALMAITRIPFASIPEYSPDRDTSRDGELADVPGAKSMTVGAGEPLPFAVHDDSDYDPAGPPPELAVDLSHLGSPELYCSGPAPVPTGPSALFRITSAEFREDEWPRTFGVGQPVNLPAELSFPWTGVVEGVLEQRVDHWVVQDGVVVGRGWPGATDDWWAQLTMSDGAIGPGWFASEWLLESCADEPVGTLYIEPFGSETEWTPLPAGEYQVYPTTSVLVRSVTTSQGTTTAPGGVVPYLVVGEPEPIVVE